ncbi:hypothetical protein MKW98_001552 [Papaver atlanticum]|uniref:SWIM-type domain-containing protein n=1 Tax=Papaver atlanticum TaxID=357466 RepID=A0AAD4X9R8_9MAGN|nr:hypothetical protein MKW98_001552 [Papaver atlanticum]
MEDSNYEREIADFDREIVEEGSGSKHLEESTETQDGRNMAEEEEGMIIDTPQMEITPVIDDDSAPIQMVAPPLFHNPHLDDGLQLEAATPVTELEPQPQPPEIDLTSFFVTDQVFESREAIIQWCQEVGKKHNTVLVITKSMKTLTGKGSKLELGCERGGWYKDHQRKSLQLKNPVAKKRKSSTRKCGCPFKLRCSWVEGNRWTLHVRCGIHNHELSATLTGHAYVGRLKEEEKQLVIHLTATGVQPQQVLTALKEKSKENYSTLRTIYNVKAKLRKSQVEGKPAMQQLMELLTQYHYVEKHRSNEETGEVRDVFWAHPESTLLAKCFPSVLMVDSTCKINRFKKPLVHVVGVTSTGKYFTVAFAFMEAETEEHYIWVLTQLKWIYMLNTLPSLFVTDTESALINAIDIVFPKASRILCTWHINQQVQGYCEMAFEDDEEWKQFYSDWNHVWQAQTKDEYGDAYADLSTKWALSNPACVKYLRDAWLIQKEKFVLAWTNKIKHLGNTTTKAESEHEKLRKYLGTAVDSYTTCWKVMHTMIKDEIAQIKSSFEQSLTTLKHEHLSPVFEELRNHVSHKALELLLLEISCSEKIDKEESSCSCSLRTTHGLPCAHELLKYVPEGKAIPLSDIDSHWKQLSIVPIQELHNGFDVLPEYLLLRKKWIEAEEPERSLLLEKIKELATSKTRT